MSRRSQQAADAQQAFECVGRFRDIGGVAGRRCRKLLDRQFEQRPCGDTSEPLAHDPRGVEQCDDPRAVVEHNHAREAVSVIGILPG